MFPPESASIAHYINYQHFALKQYSEHGLNIFTIHNSVSPYKYYLDEQFKKTATTINLLKEKPYQNLFGRVFFIYFAQTKTKKIWQTSLILELKN